MEFDAGRMKSPHDFGGETARMHEDEMLDAVRRDQVAGASHRRWWRLRRYYGRHIVHA